MFYILLLAIIMKKIIAISIFGLFILFGSQKLKAQNKARLVKFESSECLNENISEKNYINRILNSKIGTNYHNYEIFIVTNCSWASTGSLQVKGDTLNLLYGGTPTEKTITIKKTDTGRTETIKESIVEVSTCDCAFNLKYKIKGLNNRKYIITANDSIIRQTKHKYKIVQSKPVFDIINKDTINYLDIYGLKQGLHIHNRKDGKKYARIEFIDNEKVSGLTNTFYNSAGFEGYEKVENYMENKKYTIRKYYNKGKVVKECDIEGCFEDGTNCKYYTEK